MRKREVYFIVLNVLVEKIFSKVWEEIVSFWENRKKLNIILLWGDPTKYQPKILVGNTSRQTVIIDRISIQYGKQEPIVAEPWKTVTDENYELVKSIRDYLRIDAEGEVQIPIDKFLKIANAKDCNKREKLEIKIFLKGEHRCYKIKDKYRYNELPSSFLQGLFSDDID